MQIPLLDLRAQYQTIRAEIDAVVAEVFESQYFILGPKVEECERAIAAYCECAHAVGTSSGTDALLVALMSEGIGPGDEVITTPYSFFATVGAIVRLGATPVLVDIDPVTYNLRADLVASRVTPRTRAVIPVHLYGQLADMDPILRVAEEHGLAVIEDAAQAIGAEHHGRRAGSLGRYGCISFFPSKNLGAAGDGGMVVTQDAELAERLAVLRMHGMSPKYHHSMVGGNFRLDALQAAVVLVKLRHLDGWTAGRQANAARYETMFQGTSLIERGHIQLPVNRTDRHVYNQFVIRAERRDELREFLRTQGVGSEVYYPVPLHLQECFAFLGGKPGDFPESERAARETLALPIYPELSDEQAASIVTACARFYAG